MKPRPPISIIVRITAWPKELQRVQVSPRTSPVTQVAEVAVKREVTSPAERPLREAKGRFSRNPPSRISARNVSAIIRLML